MPTTLIIGAGSGIGEAVAYRVADQGDLAIVADLNADAAERVASNINDSGGSARNQTVDVASEDSVARLFTWIETEIGELTGAANVAGVTARPARLADVSSDEFARVVDINLRGVFLAMRSELHSMLRSCQGAIVNVSSAAGLVGVANAAAYTASKHGVIGLTKAAALEYANIGIRINCVAPSHIATPMLTSSLAQASNPGAAEDALLRSVPAGRLGSPSDVADAVAYLLSDKAAYITGAVLSVDGGYVAI